MAGEVSDNEEMPGGWRLGLDELAEAWDGELRAENPDRVDGASALTRNECIATWRHGESEV